MNEGAIPVAPDLLIDDCETAWTGVVGVLRALASAPTAGGSGYTAGDILEVTTGGAGGKGRVETVDGGGAVTDISPPANVAYAGGFGGYTTGTGKATSGGTGTGCTVQNATVRNVTVTADAAVFQVGTKSMKAVPSGTLAGGTLMAFRAITPGDLSAYTKLRFYYRNDVAIAADTVFRVCLCSDAVGRVIVDEFKIPATPGTGAFIQVEVARTGAGNLGASIGSIMLGTGSAEQTVSAITINLDDIWAIP